MFIFSLESEQSMGELRNVDGIHSSLLDTSFVSQEKDEKST